MCGILTTVRTGRSVPCWWPTSFATATPLLSVCKSRGSNSTLPMPPVKLKIWRVCYNQSIRTIIMKLLCNNRKPTTKKALVCSPKHRLLASRKWRICRSTLKTRINEWYCWRRWMWAAAIKLRSATLTGPIRNRYSRRRRKRRLISWRRQSTATMFRASSRATSTSIKLHRKCRPLNVSCQALRLPASVSKVTMSMRGATPLVPLLQIY
mmetsp:Transcript_21034/g.35771  ORF Transcript_21034/g.35771 Transcript_21034/m.35771 type:complete len:209 (-) Transcript_21034:489-1115(-)